jgi:hypothetical protein
LFAAHALGLLEQQNPAVRGLHSMDEVAYDFEQCWVQKFVLRDGVRSMLQGKDVLGTMAVAGQSSTPRFLVLQTRAVAKGLVAAAVPISRLSEPGLIGETLDRDLLVEP